MSTQGPWHIPRTCNELAVCQDHNPPCGKCSPRVSEGTASAVLIWDAIRPMPGSDRPDVCLRPYMLTRHSHAQVDTANAPEGAMAVSNPATMPLGHPSLEQRG